MTTTSNEKNSLHIHKVLSMIQKNQIMRKVLVFKQKLIIRSRKHLEGWFLSVYF